MLRRGIILLSIASYIVCQSPVPWLFFYNAAEDGCAITISTYFMVILLFWVEAQSKVYNHRCWSGILGRLLCWLKAWQSCFVPSPTVICEQGSLGWRCPETLYVCYLKFDINVERSLWFSSRVLSWIPDQCVFHCLWVVKTLIPCHISQQQHLSYWEYASLAALIALCSSYRTCLYSVLFPDMRGLSPLPTLNEEQTVMFCCTYL